jgi:hypothetical protein
MHSNALDRNTTERQTGWTIFDRLYLWNGTLFVVSDTPTSFPERKWMISEGHFIENGQEAEEARLPSDSTMKIISTAEAKRLFGKSAARIDGVTVSIVIFSIRSDL